MLMGVELLHHFYTANDPNLAFVFGSAVPRPNNLCVTEKEVSNKTRGKKQVCHYFVDCFCL